MIAVDDREAFQMSEALARQEALLVGISSGAAVLAAREVAQRYTADDQVVTILADTGTRYFSIEEYFRRDEDENQGTLL